MDWGWLNQLKAYRSTIREGRKTYDRDAERMLENDGKCLSPHGGDRRGGQGGLLGGGVQYQFH